MEQSAIRHDHFQRHDNLRPSFTRQDRASFVAVLSAASLLLLIARVLQPARERIGTHLQLGLPPCAFLHLTGFPCPSCGLTTSVSHAAHFHFYESFVTQPFGFVVFILAALSIPLSIYSIHRRVPWAELASFRGRKVAIYLMIAMFLLSWLYKIAAMKSLIPHG